MDAPVWSEKLLDAMIRAARAGAASLVEHALAHGLTPPDVLAEDRKMLVYADTGLGPVPIDDRETCAACLGLPWQVEPVGLGHLAGVLARTQAAVGLSGTGC